MPNRLAEATSPYLLQHQDNPVDWWEWGPEALAEARRRDVPILLSVGYAACHWCHVMAHESFEDEDTAEVMNQRYVNVKVDREERPDVDSIYMEAVQAMTGQGGWPMTVWIDHEGRPFYAGTYFPNTSRHGMPSFAEVMDAVSSAWEQRRDDVAEQASRLVAAISRDLPTGAAPDDEMLARAYDQIESSFDSEHGGFGGPPKFPQQPVLEFLLRAREERWAPHATTMLEKTFDEMAGGGIHDQVGGGFARYSVDGHWLVPHFEKMLYDNTQLARLYLWGGIELDRPDFVEVARSTLDYLARDLRHEDGGFFSSEDADSEGVEGKFYVWSKEEIEEVLGEGATDILAYYGVTEGGNFEGANILHVVGEKVPTNLFEAKRALLERRETRVRPGLDDKVVTAWNGLAIRAFAEAGAALRDDGYLGLAVEAAEFMIRNLIVGGRPMRSWREGRTSVPGFLDDHSGLAVGLYTLYAATGETGWYERAMELTRDLQRFSRPAGGFYSTDNEDLVKRPHDVTDNPLPSGNALAAEALLFAARYTGESHWRESADDALGAAGVLAERSPSMVGHHLAVSHSAARARELAIVGPGWEGLARVSWKRFRPHVALAVTSEDTDAIPLLRDRFQEGRTLAYLCRDFLCELPTSEPEVLARLLEGEAA